MMTTTNTRKSALESKLDVQSVIIPKYETAFDTDALSDEHEETEG